MAVICTINPSVDAVEESRTTLKFATRVKKVALHAERHEVVDEKALITKYRNTIAELQAQLLEARAGDTSSSLPPTPARATFDPSASDPSKAQKVSGKSGIAAK